MKKELEKYTFSEFTGDDYKKMLEDSKTYEIPKELEEIIKSLSDK